MVVNCTGLAVHDKTSELKKWDYQVRDLRPNDILIDIDYCGICHTDVHFMRDDWNMSSYPMVPGHEGVGTVAAVGSAVGDRFKVGEKVGAGFVVWSCQECRQCKLEQPQYCKKCVIAYSSKMPDGEAVYGGWANKVIIPAEFAVKIPEQMDLKLAAPLLCAGITVWAPMKHWNLDKPGTRIGVLGLGGLGHMAVQFGAKFGNEVTVISSSADKEALARELGATRFVIATDPASVKAAENSLDFIVDTVSAPKDMEMYLSMLDVGGVILTVGLPEHKFKLETAPAALIFERKSISGSLVGSPKEMEEMIQFSVKHDVKPMIEVVKASNVNTAIDRLMKNDVRFRFVIDMAELRQ